MEALDWTELGFEKHGCVEGRAPDANDLLLKIWRYGYLGRIRATRQLEKACKEPLSLLWLRGLKAPDQNSRWRFWADPRTALRKVFRWSVKVAAAPGFIGMIGPALDGTKMRAVASRRTTEQREDVEKRLGRVEEELDKMEAERAAAELEPGGDYRLPEGLGEKASFETASPRRGRTDCAGRRVKTTGWRRVELCDIVSDRDESQSGASQPRPKALRPNKNPAKSFSSTVKPQRPPRPGANTRPSTSSSHKGVKK
jgi:transposase